MKIKGLAFTFFGLCWIYNGLYAIQPLWLKGIIIALSLGAFVKGIKLLYREMGTPDMKSGGKIEG